MNKPPKVLFILNSLAGGGAERVLLALLDASRGMTGQVDFSLALLDREERDYSAPGDLKLHQLDSRFKLGRSIAGLYKLCRAERPDVTVSFLTRANVASVIVGKLLGHRIVISERANTSSHFKPGLSGDVAKAMIRRSYPRADRVIAVSRGIAEDLADNFGVSAGRIATIANPVPAARIVAQGEEEPAIAMDRPYIVAVSRLTPGKNLAMVLDAMARSTIDLPLVILGQGPEREALVARAAELGLSDRVIMPGFVSNPYAVVKRAAFYVSASNAEGFPNGQVEALALGIPVLATNCASGPSEVLADKRREDVHGLTFGDYGVLVPTNDPATMAEGMAAIMAPERQAQYRAAGPKRVEAYSVETARDSYWREILSTLGPR